MERAIMDVAGAYLYQDYPSDKEPIYLKLPIAVATALNLDPTATYRNKKYLYGLPDAGLAYYKAYSSYLILSNC